ncbi:hypothetical protein EFJ21_12505, partial [Staphylococcus haemolyticus]
MRKIGSLDLKMKAIELGKIRKQKLGYDALSASDTHSIIHSLFERKIKANIISTLSKANTKKKQNMIIL